MPVSKPGPLDLLSRALSTGPRDPQINKVRNEMLIAIKKSLDAFPSTKDAFDIDILRANYQCLFFFFFLNKL